MDMGKHEYMICGRMLTDVFENSRVNNVTMKREDRMISIAKMRLEKKVHHL